MFGCFRLVCVGLFEVSIVWVAFDCFRVCCVGLCWVGFVNDRCFGLFWDSLGWFV